MNWKQILNIIFGILLILSFISTGLLVYKQCHLSEPECIEIHDTVVIKKDSIISKTLYKTKWDTVIDVQYKDTILHDTIYLEMEHKVDSFTLHKDSLTVTEKIYHSGFHTEIDSVQMDYQWNYTLPKPKQKKFGWCITVGPSVNFGFNYDMVGNRVGAGPGVGVSVVVGPSYIIK